MAIGAVNFEDKLRVPADVFDFAGFRAWVQSPDFPDHARISFLDGEVDVDMIPEDLYRHNLVKGECFHVLYGLAVKEQRLGLLFSDGALLVNEAARLSTEPDLMYCSYESFNQRRVAARQWSEDSDRFMEISGSPEMVLEVVSNSSVRKDTVILPELYFRSNIPEFWRIDARGALPKFEILIRGEHHYVADLGRDDAWQVSPVFGKSFRLTSQPDPVSGQRYTLEVT